MGERLQRAVASLMNRVRVNRVEPAVQGGLPVFVKRRRAGAGLVIWFANRFLELAGGDCTMFVHAREWMDWEMHCAGLLYPQRPAVTIGPGSSVTIASVPGISLRELLRQNTADAAAFIAAASEVKRVHHIFCGRYGAAWSHGDLHLDNIIYDKEGCRAYLIDFDTRHAFGLDPTTRHADDRSTRRGAKPFACRSRTARRHSARRPSPASTRGMYPASRACAGS